MFASRTLRFALLALVAPLALHAQVVGGTLAGTVTDPTGAAIPAAGVIVHNDDTGAQRSLTTSATGSFSAPAITVGTYTVTAEAPGFAHYKRTGITVTVGQTLDLTLKLAVSGSDTVSVTDTPPLRQHLHRADLRPRRCPPGQRAPPQRPQLRSAPHPQPRHRQLHQSALRRRRHLQQQRRQHVLRLRPPPARQSLPAQWHRVHRCVPHQHHTRRHQRPATRHRRHPRVQRRHRHLLRRLRQA